MAYRQVTHTGMEEAPQPSLARMEFALTPTHELPLHLIACTWHSGLGTQTRTRALTRHVTSPPANTNTVAKIVVPATLRCAISLHAIALGSVGEPDRRVWRL